MAEKDNQSQLSMDKRSFGDSLLVNDALLGATYRPTIGEVLGSPDTGMLLRTAGLAAPQTLGLHGLTTINVTTPDEVARISSRLTRIEQGLNELKESRTDNKVHNGRLLDELIETAAETKDRANNMLMAPLIMPSPDITRQYLVPLTLLERLEEYRSDENISLTLAGIFGGAVLGVLGSWFVAVDPSITKTSILFVALLVALMGWCGFDAYRRRERSNVVKQSIFGNIRNSHRVETPEREEVSNGVAE